MDRVSYIIVLSAIFGMLANFAAAQNVHVVGDSMGWTIPSNTSAYSNWASGKTFMVGDILGNYFYINISSYIYIYYLVVIIIVIMNVSELCSVQLHE